MSEPAKPPGLDGLARSVVKGAAILAVGLVSVPIFGIGLLLRHQRTAGAGVPPNQPSYQAEAASEPPSPQHEVPGQADVEAALRDLTDATLPRRRSRAART